VEDVITSGPVFDGRAHSAVLDYLSHLDRQVAQDGATRIRVYLPTQYKYLGHSGGPRGRDSFPRDEPGHGNGPGYYERQVHAEAAVDQWRVTDSGVIYGPWLEGASERNAAYRFPGYHAFRKIAQELDKESGEIAEEIIPPYLARMNGA
jgi:hypothetical protein